MKLLLWTLLALCGAALTAPAGSDAGGVTWVQNTGVGLSSALAPPPGDGDTIATPFALPGLPCTVTGTTLGFTNDYDEICPYSGSHAPDVVYAYACAGDLLSINVDLCYSSYDTKVYVYDANDLVNPITCNDDYYFAPPCYTYSSYLEQVPVENGHTYYIVLDGYGNSSGSYTMTVTDGGTPPPRGACCAPSGACSITTQEECSGIWEGENTPCNPNACPEPLQLTCPEGALIEGEPLCQDNYVDNYNGGCNSTPMVWQVLAPQADGCVTVCGRSCTFSTPIYSSRDTDWYNSVSDGGVVTFTMTADFPFMMVLFDGLDCAGFPMNYYIGDVGDTGTLTTHVPAGYDVGFFAANSGFTGWPFEGTYILNICGLQVPPPPPGACCNETGLCTVISAEQCCELGGIFQGNPTCDPNPCLPVATENTSWGAIKARFRELDARAEEAAERWQVHEHPSATPNATITAKPAMTPTPSNGLVPDLLSATRPRKPGSTGVGGGK